MSKEAIVQAVRTGEFSDREDMARWLVGSPLDVRFWPFSDAERWAEHVRSAPGTSDINLLGDRQGVVDLDPEITHCALYLGVTEQ